jgi:hypothetical protein
MSCVEHLRAGEDVGKLIVCVTLKKVAGYFVSLFCVD